MSGSTFIMFMITNTEAHRCLKPMGQLGRTESFQLAKRSLLLVLLFPSSTFTSKWQNLKSKSKPIQLQIQSFSISPYCLNKRCRRHMETPNRSSNVNVKNTHEEIKGKYYPVFISFIIKQEVRILWSLSFSFLFIGLFFFCINSLVGVDNKRRQRKTRIAVYLIY